MPHTTGVLAITKRQLGVILIAIGLGGAVLIVAGDLLGAGRHLGLGPVQRAALVAALALAIVGVTLLPLGNRPA